MAIDLYYVPASAPCRSVLLAGRALGVDLNLKLTNLMEGAHLTPEFLKVKYLVKLFVHIYTFVSYNQSA
jgi:glutathione S-transferase